MTGLRNRISDQRWERRLGIQTAGQKEVNQPDSNRYATFAYDSILRVLEGLKLGPDDILTDIGCGKGRVLCCAALGDLKRVIGIDIDRELCEIARINAERLVGRRAPVEIFNKPAQDFDYKPCTACVLFNSFGEETLTLVLESIEQSLRDHPRVFRFAYVNPFYEHLFEKSKMFDPIGRLERHPWSGVKFTTSYWRSRKP